jgi:thermitase
MSGPDIGHLRSRQRSRGWTLVGLLSTLLLMAAFGFAVPGRAQSPWTDLATDRLIVKYKYPAAKLEMLAGSVDMAGVELAGEIPALGVQVLHAPADRLPAVAQTLSQQPGVAYVESDYLAEGTYDPNDPAYPSNQYGPQIVQANLAWDVTRGSGDVVVAVVDSGVASNHPDLAGKVIAGWDFVNSDPDPSDDYGHGTHVAGIVAAGTDNGQGVAAVGFNTRVMAVKVLNQYNSGYYSDIANGILYATDHGVRIINLSLGGTSPSQTLQDAVSYAWNHGVLVVAAAGNNASSAPFYPAYYSQVLAVAATTNTDEPWSLSNYGDWIDLAAPGSSVYSTLWSAGALTYGYKSGTSMAAPHVAAVAALLLAQNPARSNDQLRSILLATADDLGASGKDAYYGYGRLNAYKAVTYNGTGGGQPSPTPVPPTSTPVLPASTPLPPTPTPIPPTRTPTVQPPAAPALHVAQVGMSYKARKGQYQVTTVVTVQSQAGSPVAGATVYLQTRLPDGSVIQSTAATDRRGQAKSTVNSALKGTYTATVTDVVAGGWVYDPNANVQTSTSLTVK